MQLNSYILWTVIHQMNDEQGRATQVDHARLQALYAESDVTSSDALSV